MQQRLPKLHEHFSCLANYGPHAQTGFTDVFPGVDAVTWICFVSADSAHSLFQGLNVECYVYSWNQVIRSVYKKILGLLEKGGLHVIASKARL